MNWYKKAQAMIISFDFDGTIFNNIWNEEALDYERDENGDITGTLNQDIAQKMSDYVEKGFQVIIVSSRPDAWKNEIVEFVQEHNLPVSEIYCTNGQDKVHLLKELQVSKHFDDDQNELSKINQDRQVIGVSV